MSVIKRVDYRSEITTGKYQTGTWVPITHGKFIKLQKVSHRLQARITYLKGRHTSAIKFYIHIKAYTLTSIM